jgi:hypothetical protein
MVQYKVTFLAEHIPTSHLKATWFSDARLFHRSPEFESDV